MAHIVILSRTSQWGLDKDAKYVEQVLREAHATRALPIASIDHMDPMEFANPKPVDIQIHLEIPCRLAWPWAKYNIVVVNPEWWPTTAWNWALAAADYVVFKSPHVAALFPDVPKERQVIIPWRIPHRQVPLVPVAKKETKFLAIVGASANKVAAMKAVADSWQAEWPPLDIWCTPESAEKIREFAHVPNIQFQTAYKTVTEVQEAQVAAKYHCVASAAEGWGYTMAECATAESLPLWCDLPAQSWAWRCLGDLGKIATVPTSELELALHREVGRDIPTKEAVAAAVQSLLALEDAEYTNKATMFRRCGVQHSIAFREGWKGLLKPVFRDLKKTKQPIVLRRLKAEELPRVGIVTLTRNRPKWFTNMAQNVLKADYPTEKLVWVVVDDSDAEKRVDEQILKFQQTAPSIRVEYVSLAKPLSVGAKRNRGCAAAIEAGAEVLVMMDDDDHYPKSSIEARVTYMHLMKVGCVYCSRLPMYDCRRYISAMNVPPLYLAPAERVSEASLAFTREFWASGKFPDVGVAEGEGFVGSIASREADTAEIAPEGIIVSFLHGKNHTARRVPESEEANGCHYGFSDEFFMYLCDIDLS
jgi:hypothetical protein